MKEETNLDSDASLSAFSSPFMSCSYPFYLFTYAYLWQVNATELKKDLCWYHCEARQHFFLNRVSDGISTRWCDSEHPDQCKSLERTLSALSSAIAQLTGGDGTCSDDSCVYVFVSYIPLY